MTPILSLPLPEIWFQEGSGYCFDPAIWFADDHSKREHIDKNGPRMKDQKFWPKAEPIPENEAQAMATAVIALFDRWNLSSEQRSNVLGGIQQTTLDSWRREKFEPIEQNLAIRLSLLMGIHKALRTLFIEEDRAYAWVSTHNSDFDERPSFDSITERDVSGLHRVRS